MRSIKQLHQLVQAKDLLIAVGPAKAHKVVHKGVGQKAVLLVFDDSPCAVALGELCTVGTKDHGHVAEDGLLQAQGAVDEDLARGVGNVVVAADDVGDAHFVVVHHHGHVVGGGTVCALNDHIVQLGNVHRDLALHHIVKDDLAFVRASQTHATALAGSQVEIPAVAVVARLLAHGTGPFAHGLHFLGRAGAPVGLAVLQELLHIGSVEVHALCLVGELAVPVEAKPLHGSQDGVRVLLLGAQEICVLDAQVEVAAKMAGKQPAENGGTGPTYVQMPCGTGCKTGNNVHREILAQGSKRKMRHPPLS